MRIAVLSDIHGNLDALESVLADVDRTGVEEVVSLGDNIGYGPEPNQVMQALRQRRIPSVLGNHELAAARPRHLGWFNPTARRSLETTIGWLTPENLRTICGLSESLVRHGARFVHGFPPDSPLVYLFQVSDPRLRRAFTESTEDLCFVGHTHDLEMVVFSEDRIERRRLARGTTVLDPGARYILNVGSVGQPRDGNHDAKYLIWDTETFRVEVRYVPYDIPCVVDKILRAGLPEIHAHRLL